MRMVVMYLSHMIVQPAFMMKVTTAHLALIFLRLFVHFVQMTSQIIFPVESLLTDLANKLLPIIAVHVDLVISHASLTAEDLVTFRALHYLRRCIMS